LNKIRRVGKIAVIMGGFIILIGMILIGTFTIAFFGVFDLELFLREDLYGLYIWTLLIIGILDLLAGFILIVK
jgi:hypothetical protein